MKNEIPQKSQQSQQTKPILIEVSAKLRNYYDKRLRYIILYGSYAKGTFNPDLDIDLLIVLDNIESEMKEIDKIAEHKLELMFKHNCYLSTNPVISNTINTSEFSFYKSLEKDSLTNRTS